MSSVHYKFKSNNEFKTLTFDGVNISVADLRKEIVLKSKMGKLLDDFHLQITNPQTGEGTAFVSSNFLCYLQLRLSLKYDGVTNCNSLRSLLLLLLLTRRLEWRLV